MALLDPVRNMYGALTRVSEEAGSLLGVADSRGLMGVVKKLMGMAPEDMKQTVDETLGLGTLDLLAAGDKAAVETVLGFRKYCSDFLDELVELRDILVKFNSDDPAEKSEALSEMKALTAPKGQAPGRARRERALETEMAKVRDTLGQIAELAATGEKGVRNTTQG